MQILLAQWLSHQHVDGVSHEQVHGLAHASAGPLRDYAIRLLSQFDVELHTITTAQEKVSPAGDLGEPEARQAKGMLVEPLSQRELEVLHLIAVGRTNQEIARQLGILP